MLHAMVLRLRPGWSVFEAPLWRWGVGVLLVRFVERSTLDDAVGSHEPSIARVRPFSTVHARIKDIAELNECSINALHM
jgi:hypothetical protein